MLKLILAAFFTVPLRRFQQLQIANNDYVDYITNLTYNDAALIPLEDLPKNDFYKNFTNNNYSKKHRGIIYPPE
jgi:hypothetical protein